VRDGAECDDRKHSAGQQEKLDPHLDPLLSRGFPEVRE
jgi:hypothetical protein